MLSRFLPVFFTVALSISALYSPTLSAEIPVYGVLMVSPEAPYWVEVERGLKEGATIEQAEYYLQTPDNQSALELCNSMLERKPNVLLAATSDTAALSSCFKQARRLNIPVIAVRDSVEPFQDNYITAEILADRTEPPYSLGVKAMQQASLAINTTSPEHTDN